MSKLVAVGVELLVEIPDELFKKIEADEESENMKLYDELGRLITKELSPNISIRLREISLQPSPVQKEVFETRGLRLRN